MKILFPDTGIHFIGLPFKIRYPNIDLDDRDKFRELIGSEWLPISFDGSNRDYSRIKFIGSNEDIDGVREFVLSPVIAIDTTIGNPQEGYLTDVDIGQTFKADHINKLLPGDSQYGRQWLKKIRERKNIDLPNGELDLYNNFLEQILESLKNAGELTYTEISVNGFAEFEFRPPAVPDPISVNLYLDLGNSRSVGLLFEDDPQAPTFAQNVTPLKILNYEESFAKGFNYETEDLIFVSAVEFAKPLFNSSLSGSKTFKWPSMVKIGKEAQTLASGTNDVDTKTGISGPKRYLWDDKPTGAPWYFSDTSNKSDKIEGELLKYFANTDPNEFSSTHLTAPPYPKYARRSLLTFYIIEILNQAYRQINSPEHRDNNRALRKRRLKRLVCSYPSGYTETLKECFINQLEKAVKIFSDYMGLEPQIEVDLGLDEASASQMVFLESIIKNYKGNLGKIGQYILRTDKNSKFRIASIDIGGGTTDMMVSEYDLSMYDKLGGQLSGKIKLLDSTQYGGDDLAKDIIESFVLPQLRENAGKDNKFFWDLFFGQAVIYSHLRIQCLNLILWPLAIMILRSVMGKKDDLIFDPGATILEFLQNSKFGVKPILLSALAIELEEHGWDLENLSMENFDFPSETEVNKIIGDLKKPLLRTLYNYSLVLNAFKPSFVIVSGKLSSLSKMKELLSLWMPSSPDRIIFLDNFRPGKWYPFLMNDIISDPKTSVAAGLAIADIARNASVNDGCYVNVSMDEKSNMNFIGTKTVAADGMPQLSEGEILLDINQNSSKEYPLNDRINIVYRNVNNKNIPCNPIYRIGLKNGFLPDISDPIKMKITRNANDRTKLEFTFSGTVIKDEDGSSIRINDEHDDTNKSNFFEEQVCTILKNEYYLDNPQFDQID